MCRFALYRGHEVAMGSLLTDPENSIVHQSFGAKQRDDPLNGDGFGVAWWVEGFEAPGVFRDVTPAWSNQNLQQLARVTRTRTLLSHVRAASPGLPVHQLNCHPFSSGPYAFAHNGSVASFRQVRRAILDGLSQEAFDVIQGSTDSEHLFAMFLDRRRTVGAEGSSLSPARMMAEALRRTLRDVERITREHKVEDASVLNLVVTDGVHAVACRHITRPTEKASTLYVHEGSQYECEGGVCRMVPRGRLATGAVLIASEPLSEDARWTEVPPGTIVVVDEDLHVSFELV
jgi:predicted glutamine amidotransferase